MGVRKLLRKLLMMAVWRLSCIVLGQVRDMGIVRLSNILSDCNSGDQQEIGKWGIFMDMGELSLIFVNELVYVYVMSFLDQSQNNKITKKYNNPHPKMQQHTNIKILGNRKQSHLTISIGVWNLQGTIPPPNSTKIFMEELIRKQNGQFPDVVCVSTQECQRSIVMSLFCENKEEWENCLRECVGDRYRLVEAQTMRALHICVFVREAIADNCFTYYKRTMKAGTCNMFGNKGAISIVINLLGHNLQFINCHLQAHQNQCPKRNEVLMRIIGEIAEKDYRNEVFICGDLNYRIDMTHEEYAELIKGKIHNTEQVMGYSSMLDRDQLYLQDELKHNFLPFYKEEPIRFPPTYKINALNQQYDKKRIPGWTDRIFCRRGRSQQISYRCLYELLGTDHRPVLGTYNLRIDESLAMDQMVIVKHRDSCSLI